MRQGGFETLAAADRRDHQVEAGVLRVTALFDDVVGGGLRGANLDEHLLVGLVVFTKMSTETALSVMNTRGHHGKLLSCWAERLQYACQ
jgi:hypothetical protein